MKSRIERKILEDKQHPKHEHLVNQMLRKIETYARGECRRLGLDPEGWGNYTLSWPASIRELMIKLPR